MIIFLSFLFVSVIYKDYRRNESNNRALGSFRSDLMFNLKAIINIVRLGGKHNSEDKMSASLMSGSNGTGLKFWSIILDSYLRKGYA